MTRWLLLIALTAILNIPAGASAQELLFVADHSSMVTMYVHVSLGSTEHRGPLTSIGLGFNRSVPRINAFADDMTTISPSLSLIDFRLNPEHPNSARLNGLLMMDGEEHSSNWTNPWAWVGFVAIAGGISCLTYHWPCEHDTSGSAFSKNGGSGY